MTDGLTGGAGVFERYPCQNSIFIDTESKYYTKV